MKNYDINESFDIYQVTGFDKDFILNGLRAAARINDISVEPSELERASIDGSDIIKNMSRMSDKIEDGESSLKFRHRITNPLNTLRTFMSSFLVVKFVEYIRSRSKPTDAIINIYAPNVNKHMNVIDSMIKNKTRLNKDTVYLNTTEIIKELDKGILKLTKNPPKDDLFKPSEVRDAVLRLTHIKMKLLKLQKDLLANRISMR